MNTLIKTILKKKGLTDEQLKLLIDFNIETKADIKDIGDIDTFKDLVDDLNENVAIEILNWAGCDIKESNDTKKYYCENEDDCTEWVVWQLSQGQPLNSIRCNICKAPIRTEEYDNYMVTGGLCVSPVSMIGLKNEKRYTISRDKHQNHLACAGIIIDKLSSPQVKFDKNGVLIADDGDIKVYEQYIKENPDDFIIVKINGKFGVKSKKCIKKDEITILAEKFIEKNVGTNSKREMVELLLEKKHNLEKALVLSTDAAIRFKYEQNLKQVNEQIGNYM